MARTAGSVKVIDNSLVKEFLSKYRGEVFSKETYDSIIPGWVDDCLYGAAGQMPGTTRVSTYKIFVMVSTLNEISVNTVGAFLNRKQIAIYGKELHPRTIRYWTSIVRCASQAISHQLLTRKQTPAVRGNALAEPAQQAVVYTEEQKQKIRQLGIEGKLDELSVYVKEIAGC